MSDYTVYQCDQCGIKTVIEHEFRAQEVLQATQESWLLKHDGHETVLGIKATTHNTYDQETEIPLSRDKVNQLIKWVHERTPIKMDITDLKAKS